jgi:hypothetical protein
LATEADKERIHQQQKRGIRFQNSAYTRKTATKYHLNMSAAIPDPHQSPQ